jgi:hypothetical protein
VTEATIVTRRDVVDKVYTMLKPLDPNGENLVEDVLNYVPNVPSGISPFIAIGSTGTMREGLTSRRQQSIFALTIYTYVIYASETYNIDEQDAWITLDAIEQRVAEILAGVRTVIDWMNLEYGDYSRVDVLIANNQAYLLESIPILVYVTK